MGKIKIAVLASGRGSDFKAILQAIQAGQLDAEVTALVCDRMGAGAMRIAEEAGIPGILIPSIGISKESHDEQVLEALQPYDPRFLVMAGYMRVVSSKLLDAFRSERGYKRVVNIHPSLLPAFPGMNSYTQAYRYGAHLAGVTVHLVEESVDSGPICRQEAFSIVGCRSAEEVEELGLAIEHRLYPEALSWILPENFSVQKREERLFVCSN